MQWITNVLSPSSEGPVVALGLGTSTSMSGGDTRGGKSYGFSLMRGKRPGMEDFHHAEFKQHGSDVIGLFGVFDGHGGPNAADYVRSNIFKNLVQQAKFPSDLAGAIEDTYLSTDEQYLRQESGYRREDGCTAVTAILYQDRLLIANVGDSRAVLCRSGQAVPLTIDHKPNTKEERERIEGLGGVVVWAGTWRVGGVLAVSRAFGDKPLKKFVISTPYVQEQQLTQDDEFLIMASDGVWDVVTNEDAVSLIRGMSDAEAAAKKLSEEAFTRGSADNISCLIIRFKT